MVDPDVFLNASCAVPGPGESEPDLGAMPTSRGVAVFEDASGRTSLVASAADLRSLVRRRLAGQGVGKTKDSVDLRSVTSLVRCATVGSAFEADLVYLELVRHRLRHVYRSATDRWRGWFVEVDAGARFPRFVKTSTASMAAEGGAATPEGGEGRRRFGPLADKHAGARLVELLEDLFDLCRYHHILVRAPEGEACVYKEMGKCPAPCDGSETMASYRARVLEAAAFAGEPDAWLARVEAEMAEASGALDFERAARLRTRLERASEVRGWKFASMRELERFRLCAIASSEREEYARVFAIRAGRWAVLGDVRRDAEDGRLESWVRRGLDGLGTPGFSEAEMDRLGLVCAWLGRAGGGRKARGVRFVWDDAGLGAGLADALRGGSSGADEDGPSREIGGEEASER